ncbi:MAG: TolC family protein, partial [Elusimicrobia bacterium]|nr:TolC family protein [Elusimicrobiota bacterium]
PCLRAWTRLNCACLNCACFNNGQDLLSARSSERTREAARQSLEAARQNAAVAALNAYWGLFLQENILAVARENTEVQEEQYTLTQDRYKHGMKSLSDLLKTETDWRSAELLVQTDDALRRQALFNFNILLGADEAAPVTLDADLTLGTTVAPVLEDGLREALERRPEFLRQQELVGQAENAFRLTRIQAGPTASLGFDASDAWSGAYGAGALPFGGSALSYGFLLRVALPSSFNGYSQVKEVRAARADLDQARQSWEAERRQARQDVFQAHIDLTRALRSYDISARKEDISRQNLDIVKAEYSEGSADVILLSQAQSDYVSAQAERLQALHDAKINAALWKRAIGVPIWH